MTIHTICSSDLCLPLTYRVLLGIEPGDEVEVTFVDGEVRIRPHIEKVRKG